MLCRSAFPSFRLQSRFLTIPYKIHDLMAACLGGLLLCFFFWVWPIVATMLALFLILECGRIVLSCRPVHVLLGTFVSTPRTWLAPLACLVLCLNVLWLFCITVPSSFCSYPTLFLQYLSLPEITVFYIFIIQPLCIYSFACCLTPVVEWKLLYYSSTLNVPGIVQTLSS